MNNPELLLIVCEGKTESLYFSILQKRFRLPSWVKIIPEPEGANYTLGQHESLIKKAAGKKEDYVKELGCDLENIEVWAVCDRDDYNDSFTKLKQCAEENGVKLAFSDPQFENFLLQHFSDNKSRKRGNEVEQELTEHIRECDPDFGIYKKSDLTWLDNMVDHKHDLVRVAVSNASNHDKHCNQPFFTVQKLVSRLLSFVE